MSSISDTSVWIKFFTEAGIPAGEATNYAILFSDNRIKQDMLMDLNKEYLRDMGITAMGDIIGILKHAKTVSGQLSRDRVLLTVPQQKSKESTPPPSKKSTPATRMLEHYVRKEPSTPSPPAQSSSMSQALSGRLGNGGVKRSAEDVEDSANKRSSVFNRLGDNAVSSTTNVESPKITITGLGKDIVRSTNFSGNNSSPNNRSSSTEGSKRLVSTSSLVSASSSVSPSVFQRLGGKDGLDTHVNSGGILGRPLEYQGILKYSSKEAAEMQAAAKKRTVKTLATSAVATMKADTTTGSNIKNRLGTSSATPPAAFRSAGIFARDSVPKMGVVKSGGSLVSSQMSPKGVSRTIDSSSQLSPGSLRKITTPRSPERPTVSSSAPLKGKRVVKKIIKINKRTGEVISEEKKEIKSSVFSRLGS
ncbi:uncharacterized protein LOC143039960 [Oratosquilla oratoria]|uniref:uncharacterized protein LOC143039960 n=1 Tax=Oratosquilla oratoria TaxID=337810 RepID=UPI003F76235C